MRKGALALMAWVLLSPIVAFAQPTNTTTPSAGNTTTPLSPLEQELQNATGPGSITTSPSTQESVNPTQNVTLTPEQDAVLNPTSTNSTTVATQTTQLTKLRDVISSGTTLNLWNYFRSFINYALVIVLIIAAFANVLRLNIDTYGIKKVLPGLIVGFVLANMSRYIVLLSIDLAQVLANTANELFKSVGGGNSISQVIGKEYPGTVLLLIFGGGTIGAILAPFSAGASIGIGLLLGLLVGIFVLFFPVLILVGLYIIFLARYYVIQFLFIVSPLAFLCLGLPGLRKYFDMWWKAFSTWIFMKPIAYFILALAGLVLVTKPGGGTLIPFLVASIAMVYALIIPFRAGGTITAAINKYGRRGLSIGGAAVGGATAFTGKALTSASGGRGLAGQIGTGLSGIPRASSYVRERYKEQKEAEEARQSAAAAESFGDTRKVRALEDKHRGEYRKQYTDKDHNFMARELAEAAETNNHDRAAAIIEEAASRGESDMLFDTLHTNHVAGNAALQQRFGVGAGGIQTDEDRLRAMAHSMGGTVSGTPGSGGRVEGGLAARMLPVLGRQNLSKGFAGLAVGTQVDANGNVSIRGQSEGGGAATGQSIDVQAAGRFTGSPRNIAQEAKTDNWIRNGRPTQALLQAIQDGRLNEMTDSHINFLHGSVRNALSRAFRDPTNGATNQALIRDAFNANAARQDFNRRDSTGAPILDPTGAPEIDVARRDASLNRGQTLINNILRT